jgi:hypothetical protein
MDTDQGEPLVRIVGSVAIDRPTSQVWVYVADYDNDANWRAGIGQMRPSQPGPAQVGVTTHELLRLLGMTVRTDATNRPGRGWAPPRVASSRPAKAAPRLRSGGADRPGQLPVPGGWVVGQRDVAHRFAPDPGVDRR